MKVTAEKRLELTQTIGSLLVAIQAEQGCTRCELWHKIENENELCLLEEWDTRENLEGHMHSANYRVLRGAMSLLIEPCEIQFHTTARAEENLDGFQIFGNQVFK